MKILRLLTFPRLILAASLFSGLLLFPQKSPAGSATWKTNASSSSWNSSENWRPNTIPNGSSDVAPFGSTNLPLVSLASAIEVDGVRFFPGASHYSISVLPGEFSFTLSGAGVTNNSSVNQDFVMSGDISGASGDIAFTNGATAGNLTTYTLNGGLISGGNGGYMQFFNTSTAGAANFVLNRSAVSGAGSSFINFLDTSSAGDGTFTTNGALAADAPSGYIQFLDSSTPANATFLNRASDVSGGSGGKTFFRFTTNAANGHFTNIGSLSDANGGSGATQFFEDSSAGNATITNLGGSFSSGSGGELDFFGSSTAGESTIALNSGTAYNGQGAIAEFFDSSSAGDSLFTISGSDVTAGFGGGVYFRSNSTAGDGTFIVKGGSVEIGSGGDVFFYDGGFPSAGNGLFINEGGTVNGAPGGRTSFVYPSTAAQSTLIAQSGEASGADGGVILFYDGDGGTARIELFGNGKLDISLRLPPGITTGSIEGDGFVFLGGDELSVGSSNLSTTFSGEIRDGGVAGGHAGSLRKIGTGALTLSGANRYTGGTVLDSGNLFVTNKQGSGTGPGPVQVNGGVLGGTGRITGAVTVGGDLEGTLAPGVMKVGRLLFKGPLTFNVGGQYACELDLQRRTADRVTANGVTIDSAAGLSLTGLGVAMLPLGTVFPIINNTSADPISGTFSGVEEGAIVTVGSNNIRVSYVGGDGNDLTLTVVP